MRKETDSVLATWPIAPSLRAAIPILLTATAIAFAMPARAEDGIVLNSSAGAAIAFARYIAGPQQATQWSIETIDIAATLSKLAKTGRLRAIRRLLPFGKPQYQVLEITGDPTIKQQVIARYLSAEQRASELPASSVAMTPVNYKFHYKGVEKDADGLKYIFLVTPRQKREGLMKGELWIDGETGAAVRQAGYLVKRPSIFVRRIDVRREISFRDGAAEVRITHVSVDLRLVGLAELVIEERPVDESGGSPDGTPNR